MHHIKPEVGHWYQCSDRGQLFEVVSIDGGTVELQDFDGNLDEMDVRAWFSLDLEAVAAPEDWDAHADDWDEYDFGRTFEDEGFIAPLRAPKS
jgi:hypothetical protein